MNEAFGHIIYSISSVTLNLMLVLFLSITLYELLVQFPSVTFYELLVLNSVRNWLQTENFRGRVTDGLTITQTQTHLTLYSRIFTTLMDAKNIFKVFLQHVTLKCWHSLDKMGMKIIFVSC